MRAQRRVTALAAVAAAWMGLSAASVAAQDYPLDALEARVWLDRGDEPVLRRGDQVRIYYRVSESSFVAIFHIDTNGTARMIFPNSPQENHYARGGRDYRVLFPGSSYWFVNDDPGLGYYFIVASPTPFDFSQLRYSHFDGGWDLDFVGRQVYRDPYLAMDDYVAALIPDWEYALYALDFTAYHVDGHYDYPRFLCYDCHGFFPYRSWNPYLYTCASYRVVIYNDPYFYPVTRYRGTRVVYVQPRRAVPHFGFKERALGEAGTPQVVTRPPSAGGQPGVEGGELRRAVPRGSAGGAPGVAPPGSSAPAGRTVPGTEGTATRRPTSGATGAPVPLTRPSGVLPGGSTSGTSRITDPRTTPRGTQGGAAVRPPNTGQVTTPPRSGVNTDRPVLERRPTSGTSGGSTTRPPITTPPTRPTTRVNPGGGGGSATVPPPRTGGSGGGTSVIRGGGSSSATTPTVRSGGSATSRSTPTVRSGGSAPTRTTPTVRSGGSATSRSVPTARSGGSSAVRSSPPARGTGSGGGSPPRTSKRPPTRPPGGGGGGGASTSS